MSCPTTIQKLLPRVLLVVTASAVSIAVIGLTSFPLSSYFGATSAASAFHGDFWDATFRT